MTTMFSNRWATRLRRRRGSGKRAKNLLMETGESEDERAMDSLLELGALHGIIRRPFVLFNPSTEN